MKLFWKRTDLVVGGSNLTVAYVAICNKYLDVVVEVNNVGNYSLATCC